MQIPSLTVLGRDRSLLPPPPGLEQRVWRDINGEVAVSGYVSSAECWMDRPGVGVFHFDAADGKVRAIAEPSVPEELIADTYRRNVLPRVVYALGAEVLHASAVLTPGGVAVFCGRSGTGKSTVAFGLGRRGHSLWADDAVAFQASPDGVQAISLPFRPRLEPAGVAFFRPDPEEENGIARPPGAEAVGQPLAALFLLERAAAIDDGEVRSVRLSSGEALTTLLSHAHFLTLSDADRMRAMVQHYLELASRVPVLTVRFRPGLERLRALLGRIEADLAALG